MVGVEGKQWMELEEKSVSVLGATKRGKKLDRKIITIRVEIELLKEWRTHLKGQRTQNER